MKFEPRELRHVIRNHWMKADTPRAELPALHRRVRKALGERIRMPATAKKTVPFARRLRQAVHSDRLEWLASLDDRTATAIANHLASEIDRLCMQAADAAAGDEVV